MKRKEILEVMDGERKIWDAAGLRIITIQAPFVVPDIEIVIYPQQERIALIAPDWMNAKFGLLASIPSESEPDK